MTAKPINTDSEQPDQEIQVLPLNGELDLHTFHPGEIKSLVPEYLQVCLEKGIRQVRVVHGKGTGALRRTVHTILARQPSVAHFRLAGQQEGGWGATIVYLNQP